MKKNVPNRTLEALDHLEARGKEENLVLEFCGEVQAFAPVHLNRGSASNFGQTAGCNLQSDSHVSWSDSKPYHFAHQLTKISIFIRETIIISYLFGYISYKLFLEFLHTS